MLKRLETMVLGAAPLPLEAVRQQIASAIDIVIHLARLRDKSRRVMEISEIAGCRDGQIYLNPLYVFEEDTDMDIVKSAADNKRRDGDRLMLPFGDGLIRAVGDGHVKGCLKWTGNKLLNPGKLKMAGVSCRLCGE